MSSYPEIVRFNLALASPKATVKVGVNIAPCTSLGVQTKAPVNLAVQQRGSLALSIKQKHKLDTGA